MKPKEVIFDKISSDGDSGFRDDFSLSSGSQRGMTFTPSDEVRHGSPTEHQKESGLHFLRHKLKLGSSVGSPMTIFTHKKKSAPVKENFLQKTKRKLFGKTKKISSATKPPKAKESKSPQSSQSKNAVMEPEDNEDDWKKLSKEKQIDFPANVKERQFSTATIQNENADVKNKYCSSITKTNFGAVDTFVTRPRSMLRVMYNFRAREENDVSVRRGEMVTVLNKDDEDWWWVENSKLEQGFVPKKYIWPCACYVCQKFVLQRVVNIPGQKLPGQNGYQGERYGHAPAGMARTPVCCMNRNGINVTRPLAKTWC